MILIVCLVTFSGCTPLETGQPFLDVTGTVHFVELEGGFFGIVADDGTQYEPMNLPEEYHQNGLRVHLLARTRDDYASIFMWGTIIEIVGIEVLD
ncbi:MAG: hypothetical protein HPY68_03485 [Candidatus Atribacteria bacterium]|nr:hypothetical protein [Candidatus Atribacteria bacterium]